MENGSIEFTVPRAHAWLSDKRRMTDAARNIMLDISGKEFYAEHERDHVLLY